ncbi:radh flavin-dependent halogenase [Moniliophthora roreri MCA 2997]|uniref:Radh flavin-dependent halogenase n=1 Tax=Moniliophthora roreri (strain MCA 2997) TaxID=1381753 RepID=V2XMI8_MONRO|nr:radh flavin-dependent halogenase [Moniliophthora roreri MCA 2997]
MPTGCSNSSPPRSIDILVIGGGPAGSYAASVLAQEGLNVALCEASKFPRYHIGESLLPSVRNFLRFVGAEGKVAKHGFTRKPGGAIKFNHQKREAYTDFVAIGQENSSWNVVRSEFDELLLNHARSCGVSVFEQTKITSLTFAQEDPSRPVSASWISSESSGEHDGAPGERSGTICFKYLIDASGRAGIMSTKYLKNRHFNQSLKNIAVWGYWTGVSSYGLGTPRAGAPYFEALNDESGWAWFIPINNGTTSVGIVRNQQMHVEQLRCPVSGEIPFDGSAVPNPSQSRMVDQYAFNLSLAPGVVKLITEHGKLEEGSVKSATDFSYSASVYGGNGYRIVGDAGAFIDPFFSSGVHLALTSALSAATSICASIRGDCSEEEAAVWHTRRFSTSYTRFQIVVLSAYKQLRSQQLNILSDIDEDNFDRAFNFLRPVIQGNGDMGVRLHGRELEDCLDFCVKLFNPTDPEEHDRLRNDKNFDKALLDLSAPISNLSAITPGSAEAKEILEKVNSRKVLNAEYTTDSFVSESLGGYSVRFEKGALGLKKGA